MADRNRVGIFKTIGETVVLYFKNFPLLFSITLTGMIPMIGYLYFFIKDPKFADKTTLALVAVLVPLAVIIGMASYGALFKAFSALYRKEKTGFFEAYKTGFQRLFRLLAAYLFYALWIMAGIVMLIIPGFVFLAKYSLAPAVAVLEDVKLSPIKMSAKLTKGFKFEIFIAFILVYIPIYIPGQIISYLSGAYSTPQPLPSFNVMMLAMLPGLILGAICAGLLVVFYEKLKEIKKEELKPEELKGMNTPLGCFLSLLLFVAFYAAIIAGAIVTMKVMGVDLKKPAATSQPAPDSQPAAKKNAGK